jgi:hypothetical protein
MIGRVSSKGGIDLLGDTTKGEKGISRLVHVLHILLLSQNWSSFRKGCENADYFSSSRISAASVPAAVALGTSFLTFGVAVLGVFISK